MKGILTRRFLVSMAALGALAGGALVFRPGVAIADYSPPAYLDAQTIMVNWHMVRVSAGVIACEGSCRTAQAGGANPQRCRLVEANQATTAACLTALGNDCTPQNVINCSSGAP